MTCTHDGGYGSYLLVEVCDAGYGNAVNRGSVSCGSHCELSVMYKRLMIHE